MAKAKGKGGKPAAKGGRTTAKTAARNIGPADAKTAKGSTPPGAAPTAKKAATKAVEQPESRDRVGRLGRPVKPAAEPGLANKGGDRGDKNERRASGSSSGPRPRPAPTKRTTPTPSARYTPPIPRSEKVSPLWVPILMFTCLGLGMLTIILNYVNVLPGAEPSNVYLMVGLGLITVGFITATKYH